MPVLDRLRSALGIKRQTGDDKIIDATVRITDTTNKQFTSTDQAALVSRFVGYVAICARLNANTTAGVRVRLYRKGSAGKRSRAIGRDARKRLHDDGQVGVKAATYADRAGDDIVEVMDHPALDLLNRPNPRMSGMAYWSIQERYLEIAGNGYDHVYYEQGRPWLHYMMAQHAAVQPSDDGLVSGYWYGRDPSRRKFFPLDEVGHQKFELSMYDPYYGTGPLASVLSEHDLRVLMNQHASQLFANGARPDAHMSWPNSMGEPALKKAHDEFNRQYSGPRNAGKWILTDNGASIEPLGFALKDMEYIEGRKKVESDIMAAFGIPESLLRLNDANLASAATGDYAYMRFTILPRAIRRQEYLNDWLLAEVFGLDTTDVWFAIDNPVPKDETTEANNTRADVLAGVLTANEARLVRGYEAIDDENADALLINGQPLAFVPQPFGIVGSTTPDTTGDQTADAGAQQTTQATGAEGVASTDRLSGIDAERASTMLHQVSTGEQSPEVVLALLISMGIPEDRAKEMVASADKFVPEPPPDAPAPSGPAPEPAPPPDDAAKSATCCPHGRAVSAKAMWDDWAGKDLLADDNASPLVDPPTDSLILAVVSFFNAQRDSIVSAMYAKPSGKQFVGARKDAATKEVEFLLNAWEIDDLDDRWTKVLADAVGPEVDARLTRAAIEGVRTIRAAVESAENGEPVADFDRTNEGAARFIRENGERLYEAMKGVNQSTTARLALTLEEGVRDGEALHSLVQRVRAAFDGEAAPGVSVSLSRAKTIARSETARAQDNGTLAGWRASGVVVKKSIMLAPGACEFCEAAAQEFNSRPIDLEQPFYPKGSTLVGTDGGVMIMDFADVMGAQFHPNDRCTIQPVILGAR